MNRFRDVPVLLTVVLLFFSVPALADPTEDIARDLRPQEGVVVLFAEGEYLIDLDAGKGMRVGDLLAVVKPGKQVVHPVSGEKLGALDEVRGILQVTRVRAGFSHARVVAGGAFSRGETVRRFADIPAAFWDYTGRGEDLFDQLRQALPTLDWQEYDTAQVNKPRTPGPSAQAPPLLFVMRDGRLEVRGPRFDELFSYDLGPMVPRAPASAQIVRTPAPAASPSSGSAIISRKDAAEGLSFPVEYEGTLVGLETGDFTGDGIIEIAAAFPHRLEFGRIVDGKYEGLGTIDTGFGKKIVAIDGVDLNGDGRTELFLTAADEGYLRSFTAGFLDGRYRVLQENIPWYFRTVPLPGEGPALLAQRMGNLSEDFSGPIFRVVLEAGGVAQGETVSFPRGLALYGFVPFSAQGGERRLAQLSSWDRLKVMSETGDVLWESDARFGGSEQFIERLDPTKNPASGPATRNLFLQKRILIGPSGELLVPVNEGSRLLSRSRTFKNSHLKAMFWNGFALEEIWQTRPQQGYLADFRVADVTNDGRPELVQGIVFSHEGLVRKGRSALGVIELP